MADRIKLLPEVVANQIAAGEVVDRPSSVVKEMMENAIDAGARTVTVNFCEGGRDLIQIVDDGCGMSPVDARMAFDRHATSKIASVDDIYRLHTFGFRGEALASIAAVAQVELRTRQADDEVGTRTLIEGGVFRSQEPMMCPVGSAFFVRNLFYNVPVRRRFMEDTARSGRSIRNEFERVALCNPGVAFELYNNNVPVHKLPAASLSGRIVDLEGKSLRNNLLEVSASTSLVRIEGFVGRPASAKKRGHKQFFFVNGRYFKSPYFYKAVMKAYEKLIPESSQPDYFIYLELDADRIDVNVHPQKTEVKFADAEAVWQILNAAVRETLAKTGAVPMMDFESEGQVEIPVMRVGDRRPVAEPRATHGYAYNPFDEEANEAARAGRRMQADLSDFVEPRRSTAGIGQGYDMWPSGGLNGIEGEEFGIDVPDMDPENMPDAGVPLDESETTFDYVESDGIQQRMSGMHESHFESVLPLPDALALALFRGRLVVVDLRRARERVCYEEMLRMLDNGTSACQQLLFPERLVLSHDEIELLREAMDDLQAVGFDLRIVDDSTVEMNGTPADMDGVEMDRLLFDAIHADDVRSDRPVEVRRRHLAALMAQRRGAVMRGRMGQEQTEALLASLEKCEDLSFSPFGKQILSEIGTEELRSYLH